MVDLCLLRRVDSYRRSSSAQQVACALNLESHKIYEAPQPAPQQPVSQCTCIRESLSFLLRNEEYNVIRLKTFSHNERKLPRLEHGCNRYLDQNNAFVTKRLIVGSIILPYESLHSDFNDFLKKRYKVNADITTLHEQPN